MNSRTVGIQDSQPEAFEQSSAVVGFSTSILTEDTLETEILKPGVENVSGNVHQDENPIDKTLKFESLIYEIVDNSKLLSKESQNVVLTLKTSQSKAEKSQNSIGSTLLSEQSANEISAASNLPSHEIENQEVVDDELQVI